MVSQPRLLAVFTTARMTALSPGRSPPPVRMPIRSRMRSSVAEGESPWKGNSQCAGAALGSWGRGGPSRTRSGRAARHQCAKKAKPKRPEVNVEAESRLGGNRCVCLFLQRVRWVWPASIELDRVTLEEGQEFVRRFSRGRLSWPFGSWGVRERPGCGPPRKCGGLSRRGRQGLFEPCVMPGGLPRGQTPSKAAC